MTRNMRFSFLPAGLLLLAGSAFSHTQPDPAMSEIELETAARLGLHRVDVVELDLDGGPGLLTNAYFRMDGQERQMVLEPHSVRASGFQLLEDNGEGELVPIVPGVVRTFRGEIAGLPGVKVAAGLEDRGLVAQLMMPDGSLRWLEPVDASIEGATTKTYALYGDEDVLEVPGACGVTDEFRRRFGAPQLPPPVGVAEDAPPVAFGSGLLVAELACDADFEYFQDYGSVQAVENRITTVINAINQQYENDVSLTHEITAIVVRTTSNDPYTTSNSGALLSQFRFEWNNNQGAIQRDVAQLFTGRNLDGTTIGVAYVGAVCGSFAYGLVQSDCCFGFGATTDLSAHELGHNWSANHCSCSNPAFTMNAGLTGANRFSPTQTIPEIVNYANGLNCLDFGSIDPPPVVNSFSPNPLEAVNPDSPKVVTLNGSGFNGVTGVKINNVPLETNPPQFSVLSDVQMTITLQPPLIAFPNLVEIEQGFSSTITQLPVSLNAEPTIDLVTQNGQLFTTGSLEIFVGGQANDLHFLTLSLTPEPSIIPGLLSLDIGANLTDLFLIDTLSVNPILGFGSLEIPLSGTSLTPGTTLYFQSAVLESSAPAGPFASSSVESGTILF